MSESDDIFGYACGIVRLKVVTQTLEVCADLFVCTVKRKGIGANANSPLEKLCNWRALIEGHVMEVHSTGVQWPAPLQGPHLLIRGSPLPGKYAARLQHF
jgi:hypothetical protein